MTPEPLQPTPRIPICPRCGADLTQPDGPGAYSCMNCGWLFPSDEFDVGQADRRPAAADAGHLGTDLDVSIREGKGIGELNPVGLHDPVRDVHGRRVPPDEMRPPDRRHSLRRLYDESSRATWEQQQVRKFRLENCDMTNPAALDRFTRLLEQYMDERRRAYRAEVRRFAKELRV